MKLKIEIKQPRGNKVEPIPFELEGTPRTAAELIEQTAKKCAEEYNERVRRGELATEPLTKPQITDMASLGRITFGIAYSGKEQDTSKAAAQALLAFEDGLFRLFINGSEICSADEVLELKDNDTLAFIRLTMLTGRMF